MRGRAGRGRLRRVACATVKRQRQRAGPSCGVERGGGQVGWGAGLPVTVLVRSIGVERGPPQRALPTVSPVPPASYGSPVTRCALPPSWLARAQHGSAESGFG